MDPIKKLMEEHRVIESVLGAIPAFSASLEAAPDTARQDLAGFVTFIREFADTYHHGKEEDMLFTAMVESGMPQQGGPIAVMLAEHEQGRAYVASLKKVAEAAGPMTADEITEVRFAAAGYADLLRDHIMKEDQVLYPMAMKVVPAERLEAMVAQFAEYEAKESAAAEVLASAAAELVSKFTA